MNLDPFSKDALDPFKSIGKSKLASDDIFTKNKSGGGLGRRTAPATPQDPDEQAPAEIAPEPEKKPRPKAILRNPKWETEKVGFNEEASVSVELDLLEDVAHKTKVTFELFAKTPKGPERISQGEGTARDGKAFCKIPVFIPNYQDEDGNRQQKVEYFFLARHSEAEPLDGSKAPKLVDEMAERLIESHILPDITFATGTSFIHPKQAATLKELGNRIKEWRQKTPDGKLALFGHADAVGQEEPNKTLSERRAQAVLAFLLQEPESWETLAGKEKWGLSATQELLLDSGHDPGAIDGKDGPKTQAAVKEFQAKAGATQTGQADAATRQALYKAYFGKYHALDLKAKDFDDINGSPFAGCSEFNLAEKNPGACEANRRVGVFLIKSNKNFPMHYPCAKGDIGICKKQVARKGDRRTTGFGCFFYDKLIVERPGKGGGKSEEPISNVRWDVEKALCGDPARLMADSALPDGTEVKIRLATEDQACEETKATVKGGKLELDWKVHSVGFAKGEDGKPLAEVEVFVDIEHEAKHYDAKKNLKVKKIVGGKPETFDKHFTWNDFSVHANFQQSIEGCMQKVSVNKKVMKTWGATYVDLSTAGITGLGGGFPWENMRWARCKKDSMWPSEYWDGQVWKPLPKTISVNKMSFGTLPLVKTGNIVHWVDSKAVVWPDPVEDYNFEDYETVRKSWIEDSQKRWTGVHTLKRKACSSAAEMKCCEYDVSLEFTMERVESYSDDVICLSPGSLRSNAGLFFYNEPRVAVAAHEVGHLVGQPDEYDTGAVDFTVNGDGALNGLDDTTLMGSDLTDEAKNKIKKRHYSTFLTLARALYKNNGGKDEEWVVEKTEAK